MSISTGDNSTLSSGGGGGGASAAPVALSAPLAPGFRFHPTDEELVSYYLKRKVLGRPLRVDAIAEIDLYKCDPWDLPARSVIRSRDGEWYFFSPLDKKYANGSGKTNRATGRGYWKTTGKDRPVKRGGRMVGMKKTLVFHVGKAPKGERTNWVMHEYRLEGEYDDVLRQAGVSQDSYVVCRIFQKAGPGPQNGAQYGAPYVEDEWQDYDDFDANIVLPATLLPPPPPSSNAGPAVAAAAVVAPVPAPADEDFKGLLEEHGVSFSRSVGSLLEVNEDKTDSNNMDSVSVDEEKSVLESHQAYDFPVENYIPPEGFRTDDYLELKDFIDPADSYLAAHQGTDPADADIEIFHDMFGQNSHSSAANFMADFPYIAEAEAELMQADLLSGHNLSSGMDGVLNFDTGEYLLNEEAGDGFLYPDEPNQMEDIGESSTSSQNCVTTESSSADPFDDIAAFFDAPEENPGYSFLDSDTSASYGCSSRLASKGDVVALQMNQPSDISGGNWSWGSKTEPAVVSQADIESFDVYARDAGSNGSSSKTTMTKRLWSMLDSVSAPPALAAEAPLAAKHLVINPAAWMKANSLTFEGNGKASDGSKPSNYRASIFEPCFRMHHRVTSWMSRNGFSVCFSVLLLAASLNIGRCYSRLCFL